MDISELHRRTVRIWQERVDAIPPGSWDAPTPCEEWDVRALVNHVVGEDLWTPPLVEGMTIEEVGDQFDGDLLGDDPVSASADAAGAAEAAMAEWLPKGGSVHLSFGDTPIDEYAYQLAADHLIHSWDLAAATGQDRTLEPELVDAVAAWFAPMEEMIRSAGVIGPRVEAGGDPQSELLGAYGRSASW